jgi:hypothetical protein
MDKAEWLSAKLGQAEPRRVFPVNPSTKAPMISAEEGGRGFHDASRDPEVIDAWRRRFPRALFATPTGEEAELVVLDIDVSDAVDGWHSLEDLGVTSAPETPMSHTPRGGTHCYFAHPGSGIYIKTIAGKLGRGLDIRGDGGSVILPYGPGRRWDPHFGPETPIAPMPAWMVIPEPAPTPVPAGPRPAGVLSRYGEAALDGAVTRILKAGPGEQEVTLNGESFSIGQLAGGGVIPPGLALDGLLWAARRMPSLDKRRPWRAVDVDRKVRAAFTDGLREPRQAAHG